MTIIKTSGQAQGEPQPEPEPDVLKGLQPKAKSENFSIPLFGAEKI
jgi:hypothetical protein